MAESTRSKEKISELQEFIRRFAANKSKAKQATSRRKLIDKLQSDAVSVRLLPVKILILDLPKKRNYFDRRYIYKV